MQRLIRLSVATDRSRAPRSASVHQRLLTVFLAVVVVIGLASPVHAETEPTVPLASQLRAPGITGQFTAAVPGVVREAVNDVFAELESTFVLPAGAVQIGIDWRNTASLGVGGPVIVQREGSYFPAAVADVRFGGHHAQGPVDGFVTMGSNHLWYFGR